MENIAAVNFESSTTLNPSEIREAKKTFDTFAYNCYTSLSYLGINSEDFVQDCFEKFLRYFERSKSSVKTFSYTVAKNVLSNELRKYDSKYNPSKSRLVHVDDTECLVNLSSQPDNSTFLENDVFSLIEDVKFSKHKIPAKLILKSRMEGYCLDEITIIIYEEYGYEVTKERVRQYLVSIEETLRRKMKCERNW